MGFLNLPKLIIPANLDEIIANQKPRPLDICGACRHVKCSCGGCHSRQCAQPCAYELSGGQKSSVPVLDADGKVWCVACGGNYLPHEH